MSEVGEKKRSEEAASIGESGEPPLKQRKEATDAEPAEDAAATPSAEAPDTAADAALAPASEPKANAEPAAADAGTAAADVKPKKSKKAKRSLLRAKYDALEAEGAEPEPKKEGDLGDESDTTGEGDDDDEFSAAAEENDAVEDEGEDDDDDDDDEGDESNFEADFVEEEIEELSEPEVEPGSRRRRQPIDYAKVLAEMEAEEKKARGAEKSA